MATDDRRRATTATALDESADERARAPVPLFRQEVLDARRQKSLGDVLFVQPLSTRLLVVIALALAGALVAFTFWGEYTRKAHVTGYLVPTTGLVKVHSREMGAIVEKRVVEGQRVTQGEVLYVISMERRTSDSVDTQATAMAELEQRRSSLGTELAQQARIAAVEGAALASRVTSLEEERARLGLELQTQEARVATAESTLARYRRLVDVSLASQEMAEARQQELLEQQGKLHALERSRIALTQQIDTLGAQMRSLRLKAQSQREGITRGMSQLAQELTEYESRRTFAVAAPASGTATAVLAELGQTATPAQPLVSILPDAAGLVAHLIVPSHSIGFLAIGQTVLLRYQAFPYQRFGSHRARIAEISRTLIMPDDTALPVRLKEPAYRVTVTLDSQAVNAYGQELPLKAGMVLDADIWLDRRTLFEWILDPLHSVLGRV